MVTYEKLKVSCVSDQISEHTLNLKVKLLLKQTKVHTFLSRKIPQGIFAVCFQLER